MQTRIPMLPAAIEPTIVITEVDDARPFFGDLFRRKFGDPMPAYPHHVGTFHRCADGRFTPLSYLHLLPHGDIILVGGGCTDGEAIRSLPEADRTAIREAGGLLLHALRYSFERFADRCDAYFGHCGDARAYEVDMQAGFEPTMHDQLIVRWHKPLDPLRRRELVAKAHALGAF
jgi:hypothetical protein